MSRFCWNLSHHRDCPDGMTIEFNCRGNSNWPERLFGEDGGRMSTLRTKKGGVELSVELGAEEDAERDDVEPEEQRDAGAERAVDLGVVGEAGDIPAKYESG